MKAAGGFGSRWMTDLINNIVKEGVFLMTGERVSWYLCTRGKVIHLCVGHRVQNGSPGSTRFYGPVHLRRYWSVPVSTGPYILGRPVKFSNSHDADNLHTIRKRMPIPFQ